MVPVPKADVQISFPPTCVRTIPKVTKGQFFAHWLKRNHRRRTAPREAMQAARKRDRQVVADVKLLYELMKVGKSKWPAWIGAPWQFGGLR